MSILKEATSAKHSEAEAQPFIQSIFAGNVDVAKYATYLHNLKLVYMRLESFGDKLNLFEGIESIKRVDKMILDHMELRALLGNPPIVPAKYATSDYLSYLDTIREDPNKLLAHIYVRHMGDLFGGQALAKLLPGPNNMFKFDDIPTLAERLSAKLDISMADEANRAFDYNINIIKEFND